MALATATPTFSEMSNTRPAPLGSPASKAYEAVQNNNQNSSNQDAPLNEKKEEHSFSFGVYADAVKSLWKILSGAMVTEVLRGILKTDDKFSLAKIIDKSFRVDFISRFVGDFGGALMVRILNGKTKFLGMTIPKVHTAISSQLFTNLWVKFWRTMSSSDNLNKLSADNNDNEVAKKNIEKFQNKTWHKILTSMNGFYKNKLAPNITLFFSKIFGIKPGEKNADGKTADPSINWMHFGSVAAAAGLGTWFLPGDTQIFGFEDVHKSKDAKSTFLNSLLTWGLTSLVRLENYIFNNAVTLQPKGYGFDACKKIAVREKGFIPMAQYACDTVAAVLSKSTSMNGAFLSSILRLPIEIATTFLTASLVGVSKTNRVQDHWVLLADKLIKPIAKKVEWIVSPVFGLVRALIYTPIFGFFDPADEGDSIPYEEDKTQLSKEKEEALYKRIGHRSKFRLFLKSVLFDWWAKDVGTALKLSMNGGTKSKKAAPPAAGKVKQGVDEKKGALKAPESKLNASK